jgi:hypothetical protein
MWFAEYLFLERSWAKDEKTLKVTLHLTYIGHPSFPFFHIVSFLILHTVGSPKVERLP